MSEEIPEAYSLLIDQITKISESMHNDDPISVLEETDILLQTLDEEFIKTHNLKKLQKTIDKLLNETEYNRLLRINSKIKNEIETAIEYYDEDIGNDQRLIYNEKLEQILIQTYKEIRRFIATIIKSKLSDEINV